MNDNDDTTDQTGSHAADLDSAPRHDQPGWGYGLAAWILAAYTDPGDLVLDLDADPGILLSAQTMNRACAVPTQTVAETSLDGLVRLVTSHWPRPVLDDADHDHSATQLLTEITDLLVPGGRLALVLLVPAPTEPLTIHAGPLLAAAHSAGLGHLQAVHCVAAARVNPSPRSLGIGPDFHCALVFRRPGRHAGHDQEQPTVRRT